MPLTPHIISSLRGGLNEHPPASISDDQCTIANNVEWVTSPLGERRKGAVGIDLGTSLLAGCNFIMWMHRHTPVSNQAETQLWAMGHKDGVALLAYKDTVWHDVPMPDPLIFDGAAEYHVDAQSLHGKLFIAYKSAVNRLHVWDGTEFRRTGLASIYTGVQPLVVNMAGTATGFTKYRYYRIRFVKMVSGVVVLRSEPGAPVGFMPSGTAPGAQVERTVAPGESETHWELEAGQDNVLYYRVATTPIATLHANDTTPDDQYATVNGIGWPLTEDIGDYSLLPSCRHLSADEDRLVLGSSWSDPRITSRVMWTPPAGAVGVANDERMALDTNPYLDLDTYEGGDITALSSTVNGYIYATKWRHIYQLIRTGVPTRAYEAVPLTKQRGAIPGSLVEGFDQGGKPFCFILDPDIGPCMVGGAQGIEPCGDDLIATWPHVNVDAILPCRSLYFPEKRQVMWWVAYDSQSPNLRIVLHTNLMRRELEGTRGSSGGFALWYGASAIIFACCLYSDNIDTGGLRTRRLKPFVGIAGAPDRKSVV